MVPVVTVKEEVEVMAPVRAVAVMEAVEREEEKAVAAMEGAKVEGWAVVTEEVAAAVALVAWVMEVEAAMELATVAVAMAVVAWAAAWAAAERVGAERVAERAAARAECSAVGTRPHMPPTFRWPSRWRLGNDSIPG